MITREELKNAAWRKSIHIGSHTINIHVRRTCKALLSVADKDLIRAVRSEGYALSNQPTNATLLAGRRNGRYTRRSQARFIVANMPAAPSRIPPVVRLIVTARLGVISKRRSCAPT